MVSQSTTSATTVYYISPFNQTGWLLKHLSDEQVPLLNSKLGDQVHTDFDSALKLALKIARDPVIDDKGMDIIAVHLPGEVYQALCQSGDIQPGALEDALGADLSSISSHAAQVLNGCLSFDVTRHMRPEKLN